MIKCYYKLQRISLLAFLLFSAFFTSAQGLLDQKISVNFDHIRLADVLKEIGTQGNFYFSYNGKLLPKDSLVSLNLKQQPVYSVMEQLFHGRYEFEEQNGYVIISAALPHLSLINTDVTNENHLYSISGIVIDERSGERLMNVSVYEKEHLSATLTDEHGYFKLKFRANKPVILSITASKVQYKDVSLNFLQAVAVSNRTRVYDYKKNAEGVERDLFGRFLISTRQQIQSLNIPDFFARRPFQFSLTPGLSTHGLFSSQVVNKFSLNLAGGYTAGVNGLEIGGLFNIDKGSAKYLQLAGVFNLVGGTMTGVQFAGLNNRALDTVKGIQVAGFINKAEGQISGVQLAALSNEAHKLKGLQLGLVNVADTSEGASIGLINIIRNGFYKVSLSANSRLSTNISFASGTHRFYTIIHAGINPGEEKMAFGLGIGHDFMFSDKLFLSATIDYQLAGDLNFNDHWKQGKLLLNAQLTKHLSVFAGPVYNIYSQWQFRDNYNPVTGHNDNYYTNRIAKTTIGWEAGISFNSVFKPAPKVRYDSENWYLGIAALGGVDINSARNFIGGELFTQRDLSGRVSATLSVGYIRREADYSGSPPDYDGLLSYSYSEQKNLQLIPIKAGMRTYTGKRLFFAGELGVMAALATQGYLAEWKKDEGLKVTSYRTKLSPGFITGASAGYTLGNGLEASAGYSNVFGQDGLRMVTIRLGYRIKL